MDERIQRIIVDHVRAAAFLISDGVVPSNKEQGYVLRRLIRRMIVHVTFVKIKDPKSLIDSIFEKTVLFYKEQYPDLDIDKIVSVFNAEDEKFVKTLSPGLKEFDK